MLVHSRTQIYRPASSTTSPSNVCSEPRPRSPPTFIYRFQLDSPGSTTLKYLISFLSHRTNKLEAVLINFTHETVNCAFCGLFKGVFLIVLKASSILEGICQVTISQAQAYGIIASSVSGVFSPMLTYLRMFVRCTSER
ncbi:hypothetical protein BDY19DRAFT_157016 [Irpex rosettiformis]|uniref:Uncharacterized protein n=1 Tax=Irpex rosettiformis TaxID=378272 RepID=A0ACB8U3S5_9APHY|nr:hypothetical protein BDY19DRAFT_157016 [Irpex rosettiformis]